MVDKKLKRNVHYIENSIKETYPFPPSEQCEDCYGLGRVTKADRTITYSCHGELVEVVCETCEGKGEI